MARIHWKSEQAMLCNTEEEEVFVLYREVWPIMRRVWGKVRTVEIIYMRRCLYVKMKSVIQKYGGRWKLHVLPSESYKIGHYNVCSRINTYNGWNQVAQEDIVMEINRKEWEGTLGLTWQKYIQKAREDIGLKDGYWKLCGEKTANS